MKYKLNINAVDSLPKFGDDLSFILFVEKSDKKDDLQKFEKNYNFELNSLSKKLFLNDEIDSFDFQNSNIGKIVIHKYKSDNLTVDYFRDTLSNDIQELQPGIDNIFVELPDAKLFENLFEESYYLQSALEGILLGNYDFNEYKSEKKAPLKLKVSVVNKNAKLLKKIILLTEKLIEAVFFARDLVNEPAITLTPQELAKRVKKQFAGTKVKVSVMNEAMLRKNKMNAILSVGRGSDNPPLLLKLEYKPTRPKKKIALVGKGVTYDSGGYSIKPTDGMVDMKGDMAGAAAVIGTFLAVAKLNFDKHLIGIIPLVENMVNGKSYKPGDIVSTASGKTIEVKNTDAEGRIILADALEYASKHKPEAIIDFATLTGACVVALGEFAAGMFTKDEQLKDALSSAGNKTYELVWNLPFMDVYKKLIKSDIADISNLGPRWGGAITAAKFLENFVDENIPYVHLDIAGPALKHNLNSYTKKWATGFGVRLMTEFLKD